MPEWLTLDKGKLTIGGQSFGGMTSVRTAFIDKRVAACLTMDPWLYAEREDVFNGVLKLEVPYIAVTTEHFNRLGVTFVIDRSLSTLYKNSTNPFNETVRIKGLYHEAQQDLGAFGVLELAMSEGIKPNPRMGYLYFMNGQSWLYFLDKIGFNNRQFDPIPIRARYETFKMEDTF